MRTTVGLMGVIILMVFTVLAVAPKAALADNFAQTSGNTSVTLLNPLCTNGQSGCQNSTATGLIQTIVNWLWILATPIAVGMIIFGALQMVTAAGNEDKFATGKKTVLYAVIGYAIILIGWGITSIIQSVLG